jgi:hypothetical protein
VVNGERDSIVNGFGGSVVDERRYFSRRLSREMDPFCRTEYERGTRHLLRRASLVCAARFCSEKHTSAGEFFYISELLSSVIKA